jgi:DNA-binding response OmpR family regulator
VTAPDVARAAAADPRPRPALATGSARRGGAGDASAGGSTKVLVAEDDPDIGALLARGFASEGYRVVHVETGDAAIAAAERDHFDAVILDVMLPGASGLEVCRALRQGGVRCPIIMLSARSGVPDRVEGLAAGADDYLVKPFDFEELVARLSVQRLRRSEAEAPVDQLVVGRIVLELASRSVTYGEHKATLTEREAELLALLMRNAGRPLSRAEIFEAMWAGQGGAAVNVVDVYVGYLRRKLAGNGGTETPIRTIRGRGFLLTET